MFSCVGSIVIGFDSDVVGNMFGCGGSIKGRFNCVGSKGIMFGCGGKCWVLLLAV